ncbi:helix-turn-helix transcriptional regulator [Shimazuella kribbensis]|uniref:helix-turn-helix transcriptional regulator n=1 Tax=Shimazuella kribbensis TaxID=139808 RepID=UPI00040C231B|nr:helix-turn-helix transcriptional regulator [Shimazuella kribbensis]
MVDLVRIGGVLRAERKKSGKSIERLAEEIALGGTTISLIERGMPTVSLEKYQYYAEKLGKGILFGMANEADKKIIALKEQLQDIEDILHANPKKAFEDLKKLNELEQIESIPILQPFFYHIKAKYYLRKKEWGLAKDCFLQAIDMAKTQPELAVNDIIPRCYLDLGIVYFYQDQFHQALLSTDQGLDYYNYNEMNPYYYGLLLFNKSTYLERLNLLEKALLSIEKLEQHIKFNLCLEEESRITVIIQMYMLYATILNRLHMNERALEYAKKGIKLAKVNRNYYYLFRIWGQTSVIYESLGDFMSSERYFLKAMDLEPILKDEEQVFPYSFVHFAKLLIRKQEWHKSKQMIERSIQICRKNNFHFLLTQFLLVLGEWYILQNQHDQAVLLCLEAEKIAREYKFEELSSKSLSSLCTCYDALQDNANFLEYAKKLYRLERGGN